MSQSKGRLPSRDKPEECLTSCRLGFHWRLKTEDKRESKCPAVYGPREQELSPSPLKSALVNHMQSHISGIRDCSCKRYVKYSPTFFVHMLKVLRFHDNRCLVQKRLSFSPRGVKCGRMLQRGMEWMGYPNVTFWGSRFPESLSLEP